MAGCFVSEWHAPVCKTFMRIVSELIILTHGLGSMCVCVYVRVPYKGNKSRVTGKSLLAEVFYNIEDSFIRCSANLRCSVFKAQKPKTNSTLKFSCIEHGRFLETFSMKFSKTLKNSSTLNG